MSKINNNLLTLREQQFYYQCPTWSSTQRTEYFTFSAREIKQLRKYDIYSGVYFAITLALFKQKHTLVDFSAQTAKSNIEHVLKRYYKNNPITIIDFPKEQKTKVRIQNKVLELCGYQRCRAKVVQKLKIEIQKVAPRYPKQRGLCRIIIDFCAYNKIAIPSMVRLSAIVREIWQAEKARLLTAYKRYSTKKQREQINGLLEKTDQFILITLLKQEMKSYTTTEINKTLAQNALLLPIFMLAKTLIPQLKLPTNTVHYYASLVSYYSGNRLTNLSEELVQIYLLCYVFMRFQKINDNLLEAFKKRVLTYYADVTNNASLNATLQLEKSKQARQHVSELLIAIKNSKHKTHIPKSLVFSHVPESALEETAYLLMNDELDPDYLFWREVDKQSNSIEKNLRGLFLSLEVTILHHDELKVAVDYLKSTCSLDNKLNIPEVPKKVIQWLSKKGKDYIVIDNKCNLKRLEFWIYYQLAQQVKSNKLTLKYSLKYKSIKDDLLPEIKWKKNKTKILKTLPYAKLKETPKTLVDDIKQENYQLFHEVNYAINNKLNPNIIVKPDSEVAGWRLKSLEEENEPNDSFFETVPKRSIVDIMQLVNQQIRFTDVFDPITPHSAKYNRKSDYILAGILANALRLGTEGMGNSSDLNIHSLQSVEKGCIRMETLTAALYVIHENMIKLPLFKDWNIDGIGHGSLDGMKIPVRFLHNKAQASPKYFHMGVGLSSYSLILNHFPLAGVLIGANEYEGHFAFELSQFQYASTQLLQRISTDKHGVNSINFLLFHLIDKMFAPRIPKPHLETLWGFKNLKHNDFLLQPTKMFNETLWYDNWDNVQHIVASMLTGDANASIIINKLASPRYSGKTKRAFMQFNHILKTNFILRYVHNLQMRHAIERALNRGEAFNRLYRAIALLNKGELRGKNEIEMMIWDACTRLVAAIIQYYNTLILNKLYEKATDRQVREFLLRATPSAWTHINFLGLYKFYGNNSTDMWRWIENLQLESLINLVENRNFGCV